MQTLEWQERLKIEQSQMIEQQLRKQELAKYQKQYDVPDGYDPIKIAVTDGNNEVILTVGELSVSMTAQGAKDLAHRLRQSADRILNIRNRHRGKNDKTTR